MNSGFRIAGSRDSTGNFITSFSGRSDSLREGPYQKVNDMKGYLYTLSQIVTNSQRHLYYQSALEYLTDRYDQEVNKHTLRNSEWAAKTAALVDLYDQGFGEVDNVDLFVKFVYHFRNTTLAIECYNHFKGDSDFKGQGQPMESFADAPFNKIEEYTQRVINEYIKRPMGPTSGDNSVINFRKALRAREVKAALDAFNNKFINQTDIYQGENHELIGKLILNLQQSEPVIGSYLAMCCFFTLSDKDKRTLNESEDVMFTHSPAKEIFERAKGFLANEKFRNSMEELLESEVEIDLEDAKVLGNLIVLCDFDSQRANAEYHVIMQEENKDLLKVLIAHGFHVDQAKKYCSNLKSNDDEEFLIKLINELKDPDKAKKYYDFIDDTTKGKLESEFKGDSFDSVGIKRLEVIGVSIEIHENLAEKWSIKKHISPSKSKYTQRRADVKEKLLDLHAPEHDEHSLLGLADDLKRIRDKNSMARDVKTSLETVRNKLSSTETQSDNGPGSSEG